jgi:exopolysaccharide biosynthesis protein
MKNSYINGMLNFRVELGVIYKKQKYIVKKPQKKIIRRKYFKKFTHKYLLIVLREKKA